METSSDKINISIKGDEIVLTHPEDNTREAVVLITKTRCQFRSPDSHIWHTAEDENDALKRATESLLQCPLR